MSYNNAHVYLPQCSPTLLQGEATVPVVTTEIRLNVRVRHRSTSVTNMVVAQLNIIAVCHTRFKPIRTDELGNSSLPVL
jgi:hypothetical protein